MSMCKVCNSTNFYKEAGYFFCQTCQTQNEVLLFNIFIQRVYLLIVLRLQNIREEVVELRIDSSTRLRKTKIRQLRSDVSGSYLYLDIMLTMITVFKRIVYYSFYNY